MVLFLIYNYYKDHSLSYFNLNYLQHGVEVGKASFKLDVETLIQRALDDDRWIEDRRRPNYANWFNHRVSDVMWNPSMLVEKYSRLNCTLNTDVYVELKHKVDAWHEETKTWKTKVGKRYYWSACGSQSDLLHQGEHLIYLAATAQVSYTLAEFKGGYGVVRKCHIRGDPNFPPRWELASKRPTKGNEVNKKAQFEAEALALRFPHKGCIKWIAVHFTRNEGFTLWWNGGTIWQMLNDDTKLASNVKDILTTRSLQPGFDANLVTLARRVELF